MPSDFVDDPERNIEPCKKPHPYWRRGNMLGWLGEPTFCVSSFFSWVVGLDMLSPEYFTGCRTSDFSLSRQEREKYH